jgi:mono/diheme cytochrome c family protein
MKKLLSYTIGLGAIAILWSSCYSSGDNTGIEYAPDMYVSKGYEPFTQLGPANLNPNGTNMRLPVNGTIARGQMEFLYNYPNTADGYESSASNANPLTASVKNIGEGERLFNIYCWNCHGKKGGNDGPVIAGGKFPPPPWANYQSEYIQTLPVGKMFHTITFGKGLMGSHSSVLTPTERWQVIFYIQKLSWGDKFKTAENSEAATTVDTVMTHTATKN